MASSVIYNLTEKSVGDAIPSISSNITIGSISGVFSGLWIFGIAMCAVAAMVMYAYAGIRYETVDSGNKEAEIKSDLKRATIGIIGVFALWLLLNTINPELLRGEIRLPGQTSNSVVSPVDPIKPTQGTLNPVTQTSAVAELQVRSTLCGGDGTNCSSNTTGLHINKSACTDAQMSQLKPSCTNVVGLPQTTINMLLSLKLACGCDITITGGTEPGHVSHGQGRAPVDLALSADLSTYIVTKVGTSQGPTSLCYVVYLYNGWRYCDEKNTDRHWHVYQ